MARRRRVTPEQKTEDGKWLKALLTRENITHGELAEEMGIDNPNNVTQWISGGSPIPDLELLWLGRRFNQDVFKRRPWLNDYAQYFTGDSILDGLPEKSRKAAVANIEALKESASFFIESPETGKTRRKA